MPWARLGLVLLVASVLGGTYYLLDGDWRGLSSRFGGRPEPVPSGTFGAVETYRVGGPVGGTCYLVLPLSVGDATTPRRNSYLMLTYAPEDAHDKVGAVLSFGRPLDENARADLVADGISFKFVPAEAEAYAQDNKVAMAAVAAIRRADIVTAVARAADGATLIDHYRLSGMAAALDRIAADCRVEPAVPASRPSTVAFGDKPVPLGTFGRFDVHGTGQGGRRRCVVGGRPVNDAYRREGRRGAGLFIVDYPAAGLEGDVVFMFGRDLGKGAKVELSAGGKTRYSLRHDGDHAWTYAGAASAVRAQLRDGRGLSVTVRLGDGTQLEDFYAGEGYAAATDAALRACG